jgi:hypothetical protein
MFMEITACRKFKFLRQYPIFINVTLRVLRYNLTHAAPVWGIGAPSCIENLQRFLNKHQKTTITTWMSATKLLHTLQIPALGQFQIPLSA